jgi:hypothetical protein
MAGAVENVPNSSNPGGYGKHQAAGARAPNGVEAYESRRFEMMN